MSDVYLFPSAPNLKDVILRPIPPPPPVPPAKPEYKAPFVTYDMMMKIIKKRLMKAVKIMYKDQQGFERLQNTIQAEINMFSTYRTFKYPNLLEVYEIA